MKESEKAENNVDAKAIIEVLFNHTGLNASSLAKKLGISYQRIYDITKGRTKKFNPGLVSLICEKFPEINKNFLHTGEGNIVERTPVMGVAQFSEMMSMSRQLMTMFQNLTEKENRISEMIDELNERERALNERERALNLREIEVERLADEYSIKKGNLPMEA